MQFLSINFLICFLLVIGILRVCRNEAQRQSVLLTFSLFFYAYWDIRFLGLLFLQIVIAYFTGQNIYRGKTITRKRYLAVGVTMTLLILAVFKYFNFFVDTFCTAFHVKNTITLEIMLPVGLSFYTFQAISYIIDVYRGTLKHKYNLKQVALYIGFFPQLMSGPIVKAHDFLPQLEKEHILKKKGLAEGFQIFLFGVIKKVVIADRLGVCVDAVYKAPNAFSWLSILICIFTYAIQIYCDFSGYSDMAIGIARILGYDLGINFNCPYLSRNPSEFWARWHISLSSWFKEYVYFPLGGNRKGQIRTYFNLFIVMLLSGLWHGANITFVIWGCVHGIGSIINKMFIQIRKQFRIFAGTERTSTVLEVLAWGINLIFVSLAWVLFRADSIQTAVIIYRRLFTMAEGLNYFYTYSFLYGVPFVLVQVYVACRYKREAKYLVLPLDKYSSWLIIWLAIFIALAFFYAGNTAFIYSQF